MSALVMKFGGKAVASPQLIAQAAEIICARALTFPRIVVVVSAMGDTTDLLLNLARQVHPFPPKREQDMLVSAGERVSIALLAMALALKNKEAISFTGSQSGIITDAAHAEACIIDVRPTRLLKHLDEGKIVIVAGFQGMSQQGEITTLGRGGSDISAVALAVALKAQLVEFYKDVGGIFAEDPKRSKTTAHFPQLTYKEVLSIIQKGGKAILEPRAIILAEKNHIPLQVLSFNDPQQIKSSGTVICEVNDHRGDQCYYEERAQQ